MKLFSACILFQTCLYVPGVDNWNCGNSTHIRCCIGYFLKNNECQQCPAGTIGMNCTSNCLEGYYGKKCLSKCRCQETERCDKKWGCVHVAVAAKCLTPECNNEDKEERTKEQNSDTAAVVIPILVILILFCIGAFWMKFRGCNQVAMLKNVRLRRTQITSSVNFMNTNTTVCRANDDVIYDDIRESRMLPQSCSINGSRSKDNDDVRYQDARFLTLKSVPTEPSPYSRCEKDISGTYCKLAHDGQWTPPKSTFPYN